MKRLRNLKRLAEIVWIILVGGCAAGIPPALEAQYNAERLAAEESGLTCKEAVHNVAAVDKRWEPVWTQYSKRPVSPAPVLVCGGPDAK